MIDLPPSMPSELFIVQKLVACGIDQTQILVAWQPELQSVEMKIRRAARASSDQFACIHKAAGTRIVTFEDQSLQSAYTSYAVELYRPRMIADTEASVKKLGVFDGFPKRSNYADLGAYAEALEQHCGLLAGSVLRVSGDAVTFVPLREKDPSSFTRKNERSSRRLCMPRRSVISRVLGLSAMKR